MKIISHNLSKSVALIQSHLKKGKISIFCGAGISVSSGIPTAIPIVQSMLSKLGCTKQDSELFLAGGQFPIPFESVIQELKETLVLLGGTNFLKEFSKIFKASPNSNHYLLAQLLDMGMIDRLLTTNFDCCFEKVLREFRSNNRRSIVYAYPDNVLHNDNFHGKIIKLHGCLSRPSTIGATVDQITKAEFFIKNKIVLNRVLANSNTILFIGYSCSDKWDITKIFSEISLVESEKPMILFWQHSSEINDQPTENCKKIFKSYKCVWMSGDTEMLIKELAIVNKINIPFKRKSSTIELSNWNPLNGNYALGNLFKVAHIFPLSKKYTASFIRSSSVQKVSPLLRVRAIECLAYVYRKLREYENSKAKYLQGISLLKSSTDGSAREIAFTKSKLYNDIAMLQLDYLENEKARDNMIQAISIVAPYRNLKLKLEHKYQLSEIYGDYGYLLYSDKEYQNAVEYWELSLKLKENLSAIYPQRYLGKYASSLNNLGAMYYFLGQNDPAIQYSEKAIDITKNLAEVNPVSYNQDLSKRLNNLGCIYREKLNRPAALRCFKESLSIKRSLAMNSPEIYLPEVAKTLINLSVLYQKPRQNRSISLRYLDEAIDILDRFKHSAAVNKYYNQVNDILMKWGLDPSRYLNS